MSPWEYLSLALKGICSKWSFTSFKNTFFQFLTLSNKKTNEKKILIKMPLHYGYEGRTEKNMVMDNHQITKQTAAEQQNFWWWRWIKMNCYIFNINYIHDISLKHIFPLACNSYWEMLVYTINILRHSDPVNES